MGEVIDLNETLETMVASAKADATKARDEYFSTQRCQVCGARIRGGCLYPAECQVCLRTRPQR